MSTMYMTYIIMYAVYTLPYSLPLLHAAEGRRALLDINLTDVTVDPDVDLDDVAARADGYSGADITNVCRYM